MQGANLGSLLYGDVFVMNTYPVVICCSKSDVSLNALSSRFTRVLHLLSGININYYVMGLRLRLGYLRKVVRLF